jgi:hypothetical protein
VEDGGDVGEVTMLSMGVNVFVAGRISTRKAQSAAEMAFEDM